MQHISLPDQIQPLPPPLLQSSPLILYLRVVSSDTLSCSFNNLQPSMIQQFIKIHLQPIKLQPLSQSYQSPSVSMLPQSAPSTLLHSYKQSMHPSQQMQLWEMTTNTPNPLPFTSLLPIPMNQRMRMKSPLPPWLCLSPIIQREALLLLLPLQGKPSTRVKRRVTQT